MGYPSVKCPKCDRLLPPDGEMSFNGHAFPIYCCPECVTRKEFMGQMMELALMFCIGPDGKPCDPADPDGEIDLTRYE